VVETCKGQIDLIHVGNFSFIKIARFFCEVVVPKKPKALRRDHLRFAAVGVLVF
jgi:hypothetical protein